MIYETLITTVNANGAVHIAPMGISRVQGFYVIAPFKPSTTLDNLKQNGAAVINLVDDVRIFAGCLTGRRDWPTGPAEKVSGLVLEASLAHVELEVSRVEDNELRPAFYCTKIHERTHAPFMGFNRAQAAVLEAAILVSRLSMLPAEKIKNELDYLQIAIDKTAGNRELVAWEWLMDSVEDFFQAQKRGSQA